MFDERVIVVALQFFTARAAHVEAESGRTVGRLFAHDGIPYRGVWDLHRFRHETDIFKVEIVTGKRKCIFGPGLLDDLKTLFHPTCALLARYTVSGIFRHAVTETQTEVQPSLGDNVDSSRVLDDLQGVLALA